MPNYALITAVGDRLGAAASQETSLVIFERLKIGDRHRVFEFVNLRQRFVNCAPGDRHTLTVSIPALPSLGL